MRYPNAAKGLRLMFIGQVLAIISTLMLWVPVLGPLVALAAIGAEIVGIYQAGQDDENYRGALVFAALGLVVNVVMGFLAAGFLRTVLSMAADILNLLMMFAVCNTTCNLLHSTGKEALARRGGTVIKIYAACTAVSIVCQVLGVVPIINIAAGLVAGIAALVQIVGYVMYLLFLHDSGKVL